ncbi:MAG TPA: serine/threonine-protein phosphatase, partial [Noviherbaspirillum sp.]|nr:serine/threonine-protein phosphatase [Noviherbaspirillum sp.]
IAGKSSDNVTALAMMWEGGGVQQDSPTTITTHTLPVGTITTTIQAPRHADLEQVDVFNESEIEKAIEEIRGAIEKTSRLTSKN